MNQTQRKYLIEKITSVTKTKIAELNNQKMAYPSASNYFFKAIMNDTLELQPKEHIIKSLKKKALQSKEGSNWLSDERMSWDKERKVTLMIGELLVFPQDYYDEKEKVEKFNANIVQQIEELKMKLDGIEMRVQLASDKTLQNLINEVDDMGDLRLVDTQLKRLN